MIIGTCLCCTPDDGLRPCSGPGSLLEYSRLNEGEDTFSSDVERSGGGAQFSNVEEEKKTSLSTRKEPVEYFGGGPSG